MVTPLMGWPPPRMPPLPPPTSLTTLECETSSAGRTMNTTQGSPAAFSRWLLTLSLMPTQVAQKPGGRWVDLLHLPFGLPWHSQRPWPRHEEPKVSKNDFWNENTRHRVKRLPVNNVRVYLICKLIKIYSSHHEHDPTGSLEMIPENCPLDPVQWFS